MKKLFVASFVLHFVTQSNADTSRIQSLRFDKGEVQKIYLAPGLGSMLNFPCAIEEAFVGRSEDLKAQVSPNDKRTLFLNLRLNTALPTNLIVRCGPERNVFVFDVLPQRSKHQDLVEIRSVFGRPKATNQLEEVKSRTASSIHIVKTPELIENGGRK